GELVRRGVVLNDLGGPVFVFTKLNEIKPDMIAAATRNARESAEQFAADSRSRIGGIHRATQGLFQILPRDESQAVSEQSQVEKKVRVVTTMEYLLTE
ncbi:MAG TPA: SIMPL domain-containing protein, partial [Candidatus Krumholzibacteria bacterium]|nr:SIMPL domain-containing protein [Candidatus Krumholzibacteria bacterium]